MAPHRHPLRSYILALARAGELDSLGQAALIADVSPMTVSRWLRDVGFNLRQLKLARIARLRTAGQLRLEQYRRSQSRAGRKRNSYEAIKRFNRSNGHD